MICDLAHSAGAVPGILMDADIDFAVGCSAFKKVGVTVERGETLLCIHARSETSFQAVLPLIEQAVTIR